MQNKLIDEIRNILGIDKKNLIETTDIDADEFPDVMRCISKSFRYSLKNGKIIGLNLVQVGLTDEKWTRILGLPNLDKSQLKAINLSENDLTKFHFTKDLKSLRWVNLSCNALLTEVQFSVPNSQLERLDIAECSVKEISFSGKLKKLKCVDISRNQLTKIIFEEGDYDLSHLEVSHNQLKKLNFEGKFKNLRSLYAGHNRIKKLRICNCFSGLFTINLAFNQLNNFSSTLFTKMPNLRPLYLYHNPLIGIPLELIGQSYHNCLTWTSHNQTGMI